MLFPTFVLFLARRFGHSLTAVPSSSSASSSSLLYVYGGFRRGSSNLNDLWQIDTVKLTWIKIQQSQTINPGPRGYHSVMATQRGLQLFGGNIGTEKISILNNFSKLRLMIC